MESDDVNEKLLSTVKYHFRCDICALEFRVAERNPNVEFEQFKWMGNSNVRGVNYTNEMRFFERVVMVCKYLLCCIISNFVTEASLYVFRI